MATDTTSTGRDSDKFMLRLPEGMRDKLKEAAERENRTLNAEIVGRLEESLRKRSAAQDWMEARQARDHYARQVQHARLIQECRTLGEGVLRLREILYEHVDLDRESIMRANLWEQEARRAIAMAKAADPEQAIEDLRAAQARAEEASRALRASVPVAGSAPRKAAPPATQEPFADAAKKATSYAVDSYGRPVHKNRRKPGPP